MTNREKLRCISDKKLAAMINKKAARGCDFCFFGEDCPNPYTGSYCIDGICKWLSSDTASGGASNE